MMDRNRVAMDDRSVGSLAFLESGDGEDSKNNRKESYAKDLDNSSPQELVISGSRFVSTIKALMLFLLIGSGLFLSLGSYLASVVEIEGKDGQVYKEKSDARKYALIVMATFILLISVFLYYDYLNSRRQSLVLDVAARSRHIVDSLFPKTVRDRLLRDATVINREAPAPSRQSTSSSTADDPFPISSIEKAVKSNALANSCTPETAPIANSSEGSYPSSRKGKEKPIDADVKTTPIADLFQHTTVLFADISGFTAWSSARDPPQVFMLLEAIYAEFDSLAEKLKVFKVETIGDCYMAVTGLPDPNPNHAIDMARFAYQCLVKMTTITEQLEQTLGPGTGELTLRIGLHSGPVTAGVLRGQKFRFQLFGDTVNTASRMESTGKAGMIQMSQETADLLLAAGKMHWLKQRDDTIVAKGKGELRTYWLEPRKRLSLSFEDEKDGLMMEPVDDVKSFSGETFHTFHSGGKESNQECASIGSHTLSKDKFMRLVEWNTDVLVPHLYRVMTGRRKAKSKATQDVVHAEESGDTPHAVEMLTEAISIPPFDATAKRPYFDKADPMIVTVRVALQRYVTEIASMYYDNPFHTFEHAAHATLAANKLVMALSASDNKQERDVYQQTFGIGSDPLTQFAIVLASLVHGVDHPGLPNSQLVQDEHELAIKFKNKCVAEQNAFEKAWEVLMSPQHKRLRSFIYKTNVERKRFRQVLVNAVLATDFHDPELNERRSFRWDRAFHRDPIPTKDLFNRKATLLVEYISQAASIAHTMQHWRIFRRWNERFFYEICVAQFRGRVDGDAAETWYAQELAFYDTVAIPLAQRLRECGTFGAIGEQHLQYALENRKQWESDGIDIVEEMFRAVQQASIVDYDEDHAMMHDSFTVGSFASATPPSSMRDLFRLELKNSQSYELPDLEEPHSTSSDSGDDHMVVDVSVSEGQDQTLRTSNADYGAL